jgi:hypothetical protein
MKGTIAQVLLWTHLSELGMVCLVEHLFCEDRKWRFDLAFPPRRLAFEISGGNWTGGHRRGNAQESEYDKLNTAQLMGWRVMQWTNRQVLSGEAREFMQNWVKDAR